MVHSQVLVGAFGRTWQNDRQFMLFVIYHLFLGLFFRKTTLLVNRLLQVVGAKPLKKETSF